MAQRIADHQLQDYKLLSQMQHNSNEGRSGPRGYCEVDPAIMLDLLADIADLKASLADGQNALRDVAEAIERADPEIITDTIWMPAEISMGTTMVDFIGLALERSGAKIEEKNRRADVASVAR